MASKYEGKMTEGGKSAEDSSGSFEVTALSIEPNDCDLQAELNLTIEYDPAELTGATWNFQYMVDSVRKRHIIKLGSIEDQDIKIGHNSCEFHVDSVNVSGIRPSRPSKRRSPFCNSNDTTRRGGIDNKYGCQVAKTDSDANFGGKSASDEEQGLLDVSLTRLTDWSLCRSFVSSFLFVWQLCFLI